MADSGPRILFIGDLERSAHALAVDNHPALRGVNGYYRWEVASVRADLLAKLGGPPYDVVIVDGTREVTLAEVQQLVAERWPHTPVIALEADAARTSDGERAEGQAALDSLQCEIAELRAQLSRTERQRTFNAAAAAILKARTPQDVYNAVASELIALGLYAHILELEPDREHLSVVHVAFPPSLLSAIHTALGQAAAHLRFSLAAVPLCAQALAENRALFTDQMDHYLTISFGRLAKRVWPFLKNQCLIVAPLSRQDQPYGTLVVTGQLTEDDLPAIDALAAQISAALENAQLYEETRRTAEQMHLVNQVGRDIAFARDFDDVLQTVVTHVKRAFGYYDVDVGLVEDGAVVFRDGPQVKARVPLGHGLSGWVAQTGQPVLVSDVTADARFLYHPPLPDTRAELAVPIFVHDRLQQRDRPIGVLDVQSDQTAGLDSHDLEMMQALAAQIAAALQNARLLRERDQRLREFAALLEASESLARALDGDAAMHEVAELMVQLLGVDDCAISTYDATNGTVSALAQFGHQRIASDLHVPYRIADYPATARCLLTGEHFLVQADNPEDDPAERAFLHKMGAKTLLAMPVAVTGRIIGLAELYSLTPRSFESHEIALCQHLAVQAGVAMENARLYQQVSRRAEEVSALLASAAVITSSHTLRERLETIARQAIALVKAEGGTVYLLDTDGLSLQPIVALEDYAEEVLATPLRVGEGITGAVAQSGKGEIVNDVLGDLRAVQIPGTPQERECLITVPLAVEGAVIGVMSLIRKGEQGFIPHDLELLTSLAQHAAMAIKNARLLEGARRQAARLHALYSIAATAGRSLELGEMLDAVLAEVLRASGMEVAFIHLVAEDGKRHAARSLFPAAQRGTTKLALHGAIHVAEDIVERAIATGRTQVGILAAGESTPTPDPRPPTPSIVAVPLSAKGRTVGVLTVGGGRQEPTPDPSPLLSEAKDSGLPAEPSAASGEQVQLLEAIAQQVAVAIENAQLVQALRQRAESLERAYAELAEADRLKDELIQNVSHELRTPLTFVKGYADLLANGDLGPLLPEQLEAIQTMVLKSNVLVRLVGDIVSLHAVSPSTLVPQILDLALMADAVVAGLQPEKLLTEAGIRIRCDYAPNMPQVRADPERMTQVFENLLSNAIKFSPDGGQITVRMWWEDALVYVAISDTGIGIPPDKLARIWERFYQVDGSTTRRFGGAGLGLTLCKQIIEAHGGNIYVESEVGKGTTFWFALMAAGQ
jgi:signal transduction histidine kinase/putative methionine-R-sulfoxide reductase with GAF domain